MTACKSYRARKMICEDGFTIKPICTGYGPIGCFHCGNITDRSTPNCQREDFAHPGFVADDGSMILRRNK